MNLDKQKLSDKILIIFYAISIVVLETLSGDANFIVGFKIVENKAKNCHFH
jgi:hypothetical protein